MKTLFSIVIFSLLLAACSPAAATPPVTAPQPTQQTPFPMSAEGNFTGSPQDFILHELGGLYLAADAGTGTPNSHTLEVRPDGQAYIDATGRLDGWQIQFNRSAEGDTPAFIVNVVNMYSSHEGALLVLSRDWHQDVWTKIDSGELTLLPEIPDLGADQLIWTDAAGTIGVEIIYRNLYIFFTGPSEGVDQYDFLANLAKQHLAWIQAQEP